MRSIGRICQIPLFATCTIANAILALLRVASRPDFFVMGLCCPFALRYAGQLQTSWRAGLLVFAAARCVPISRCNAGGSACLSALWPATSVRRLVWPRNFARDLPRQPCASVFRWRTVATLSMRTISWHSGCTSNRVRTACVTFAPWPQGSASRRGLSLPSSTLHTIACKSIPIWVPGLARVRLPALSLLPGMH